MTQTAQNTAMSLTDRRNIEARLELERELRMDPAFRVALKEAAWIHALRESR